MPKDALTERIPPPEPAFTKVTVSAPLRAVHDSGSGPVEIRTGENTYKVPGESLGPLSIQWYYTARNRRRWADAIGARQALAQTALIQLGERGVDRKMVDEIGKACWVEIGIPYEEEGRGWAARILPWECLLRTATGKPDLTITRHLAVKNPDPVVQPPGEPTSLLFVKSAPGPLSTYSFDTEQCLVEGSLGLKAKALLDNPTAAALESAILSKPSVIHLAGFDLHQGDDFIDKYNKSVQPALQFKKNESEKGWDGMYFAGSTPTTVDRVDAVRLGGILNPRGAEGALVTCNIYHSAARVAAMAVASGAAASIGFQDIVDDALAERFFASLFQQWRTLGWDLLGAFEQAWKRVGIGDGHDSGVVLWSRTPLLQKPAGTREVGEPLKIGAGKRKVARVRVEPNEEINYSLLHNGDPKGLFNKFRFEKYEPQYAYGIDVSVALYMGAESFPYQATFDLDADDPVLDIASHVNLPLTSHFARSLREDVITSLHVCVSYDRQELYQETHRVKLLAVNQWTFDRLESARWLASFVLPGDPAVARVVDAAQKYLMALRDDSGAGFDGYQSDDDGVDMQVRALWAALSFDLPLSYINPPPVFTEGSQRLRTPSDVINGKRGTCIDLALLFAACLELVEIYPVIFLLSDHAFPGYWRNEQSYQNFLKTRISPEVALEGTVDASSAALRLLRFEEVGQCVRDGALVPLETVWLTNHSGFAEAVSAGIDNLRTTEFEALVNIYKLRAEHVTPLPIAGESR